MALQTNITTFQEGAFPVLIKLSADTFKCPLCHKEGPYHALIPHIQGHQKSVVKYKGYNVYKCHLRCLASSHYHCCSCPRTIVRKELFLKHLKTCLTAGRVVAVIAAPPPKPTPPAAPPLRPTPPAAPAAAPLKPTLPAAPVGPPLTPEGPPKVCIRHVKMGCLSDFQRGQIVGARMAGASVTKTAELCNVSRKNVSEVMLAYQQSRKAHSAKHNSGPKAKLSDGNRRKLQHIVSKNHKTTAAEMTAEVNQHLAKAASTKTVCEEVSAAGDNGMDAIDKESLSSISAEQSPEMVQRPGEDTERPGTDSVSGLE